MSYRTKNTRNKLQRINSAAADSDKIPLDHDVNFSTTPDPWVEITEDPHPLVERHIDFHSKFGSPSESGIKPLTQTKYVKKTPVSKKKKQPSKKLVMDRPIRKSQRTITPRTMYEMKEAQAELHTSIEVNQCSRDISVVTNDSLNISGIQSLKDSSTSSEKQKSDSNSTNNKNDKKSLLIGVVAFVDYKLKDDHTGSFIIQELLELGAKIGKTFNRKVTHVVFRDGYRKTYNKAIERNIPLVSAKWIECCKMANKILDPVDYPPVDIEKYLIPKPKFNFSEKNHIYKCLRPMDYQRDQILKKKIADMMERVNNLGVGCSSHSEEINDGIETTQETESSIEQDEHYQSNDIISLLSNPLKKLINPYNNPIVDEGINNLYIPITIKIMRKHLTPEGRDKKSLTELDSELLQIENRLKLDSQDRLRLRKLLFPSDEELNNMSIARNFPSPSPQKLKTSIPANLSCTKTKKREIFGHVKKSPLRNNYFARNTLKLRKTSNLRPKKVKNKLKSILIQETTPNMFSRSSMIFQASKVSVPNSIELKSITCTGLTKTEVNVIKRSIQNLGSFIYHSKVKSSTNFVVTKSQLNRTVPMVFAMAVGCYIISEEWIHESYKVGKWLPYHPYLIQNLSEPIKEFQIRRQSFGSFDSSLKFHIFDRVGIIYIADTCKSTAKDLKRLVRTCGGQCTSTETKADVVVGYTPRMENNIDKNWIFDCISQGMLLNKIQYKLVNNIT